MISNTISTIPNFVSQAQLLIPIMHNRLSGDPSKKITLSKSLSATKPSIISIEDADADCITLEDFLAMLDIRINAEFTYRNEITQLKDNLCEEINKLCDGVTDENFIKFVRDQRQKIVNTLVNETRVEQKMIAERFYNDMMNGWDEKALGLKQFSETVNVVLRKNLLSPLPIGALDLLKKLLGEMGNDKSTEKIAKVTTELVNSIQSYLKVQEIKDSDYNSSEDMRPILEALVKGKQTCNIEIKDIMKSEKVINEFRNKCIEKVTLETSTEDYLKSESLLDYDELKLSGGIGEINAEHILNKIPRTVVSLSLQFEQDINYEKMKKILSNLELLKSLTLNLDSNGIGPDGVTRLSDCLRVLTNLSTLNISLEKNNLGADGAIELSSGLKVLTNLSNLELNIWSNDIGDSGAAAISDSLKELTNLTTLSLYLGSNAVSDNGVTAVSASLKMLIKLVKLNLVIWDNKIGADGAIALSEGLKQLTNLYCLKLNLWDNKIEANGVAALSGVLKVLTNLSNLNLNLRSNNIGAEGTATLSGDLKALINVSSLDLDLGSNNIGNDGAQSLSSGLKALTNLSNLILEVGDNNIGEDGKIALNELKLAHPNYEISAE